MIYHKQWPIWGGLCNQTVDLDMLSDNLGNDIIGLGHANGWVSLWSLGRGDTLLHLGTIPTNCLYNSSDFQQNGLVSLLS